MRNYEFENLKYMVKTTLMEQYLLYKFFSTFLFTHEDIVSFDDFICIDI